MMEFLKQSWGYIAGAIGIITLLWNFRKLVNDIKDNVTAPFTKMDKKIDDLTDSLNKKIDDLSDEMNTKVDRLNEKIDTAEESDRKVRSALLTMQRKSLLDSCEDFIKRGFATLYEKETITDQYNSYHELGGDQFITDLVNKVVDLPLEKQKVAKKSTKSK